MKHVNVALFVVHKGCPHMCSFCNQRSISGSQREINPDEVRSAAETAMASLSANEAAGGEIAFFGGSFTMIERGYMISLLEAAYEYVEKGIGDINDIQAAFTALLAEGVDAIYIPTDNTLANGIATVHSVNMGE